MTAACVLDRHSPAQDVARWAGGKAANLHRLTNAGLDVPAWAVLGSGVLTGYLETTGLGQLVEAALAELQDDGGPTADRGRAGDRVQAVATSIQQAFARTPLDPASRAAIVTAYREMGAGPVAVRSSAAGEDSAALSFAGQYDSFLNVSGPDQVADQVRACWVGAYSARALTYRRLHDLPAGSIEMAVIIQALVPADSSGVLFTANPLTGRRDEMLISAVYGLGEGLVSGAVDADTLIFDRAGARVTGSIVGDKREQVTVAADTGCVTVAVEPARRGVPVLSPDQVDRLRRVGERIEALYPAPQDIEWAFAGERLYLLQSRPITALPDAAPAAEGGEVRVWDNSNIIESYGEITSPLTFSFALDLYGRLYREYCDRLGVPRGQLDLMDEGFADMLGYFDGRVYYNVLNWIKVIGLLPAYSLHRRILDEAMGVAQTPIETAHRPRPLQYDSRLLTALVRARIAVTFGWYCLTVKGSVERFIRRFDVTYREFDGLDYQGMPAARVYRHFTRAERTLLAHWGRMAVLDNVIMLSYGVLHLLTGRWLPQAPEWFRWQVVKVGDDVESTQPARELTRLARELIARPELAAALDELPVPRAYDWLQVAPGGDAAWLRSEIDSYLKEFGYRSANELKLEEPDLRQDPTLLMSMLRDATRVAAAGSPSPGSPEASGAGPSAPEDADEYLRSQLRGPRRWVYERVRRATRTALRERERVRFARTRAFGMARQIFTAIGSGLAGSGALADPRDVFFLRLEELRGAFTGTIDHRELGPLAVLRRAQQDQHRGRPAPPPRFVTVGGPYWVPRHPDPPAGTGPGDAVLRGVPSSPGVVVGEAKVLTEPREAGSGIVVTYRTDPGWVGVLSSAAALLIERGSPLTHVAIVARELGVPTVVQIPGLTDRVRTGMRLSVDGARGTITIIGDDAEDRSAAPGTPATPDAEV